MADTIADELYAFIANGNEQHRQWLREKVDEFFAERASVAPDQERSLIEEFGAWQNENGTWCVMAGAAFAAIRSIRAQVAEKDKHACGLYDQITDLNRQVAERGKESLLAAQVLWVDAERIAALESALRACEQKLADRETLLRAFMEDYMVRDLSDETFDQIEKRAYALWDIVKALRACEAERDALLMCVKAADAMMAEAHGPSRAIRDYEVARNDFAAQPREPAKP